MLLCVVLLKGFSESRTGWLAELCATAWKVALAVASGSRSRGEVASKSCYTTLETDVTARNNFFPPLPTHSMSSDSHARVPPAAAAGRPHEPRQQTAAALTDHTSRHRPCNPTAPAASLSPLTHQRLTHARALIIIHHIIRGNKPHSTHRMEKPSDAAACAFAFRSSRAQLASSTGPSGASSPWPPRAGSGRGAAWSPPAWSSPCPPAGLSS